MRHLQALLIALVALLGLAAAAEASVDLWTPPLFVGTGDRVECKLTNVSPLNRTVRIRIYNHSGVPSSDTGLFSLPPFNVGITDSAEGPDYFTCRFTVPSRTVVRADATLFTAGTNDTDKAAVPAQ